MAQHDSFYSILPFDVATDRLKRARVEGVKITVKQTDTDTAHFRMDLRNRALTLAHLKGTIQQINDDQIEVTYKTHALSRNSILILPTIGVGITAYLMLTLPPEFLPIASAPGVAGVLFALFWTPFGNALRKTDQFRLQELLGRMLEKQTHMAIWQEAS